MKGQFDGDQFLAAGQSAAIAALHGTLIAEKDISAGDVRGREFSASFPGGTMTQRVYLFDRRLVQLLVVESAGLPLEANRYFDSFVWNGP